MNQDKHSQESEIQKQLEQLIDKKISDAKLDVSEKRLRFVLIIVTILLSVLGIGVPLLLTLQSSHKVDASVQRMEEKLIALGDKLSSKVETSTHRMEDKWGEMTANSSTRVDTSIQRMEDRFRELAGKQLRKPKLECFISGKRLMGTSLVLPPDARGEHKAKYVELKNIGDGAADNVRVMLYLKDDIFGSTGLRFDGWEVSPFNDKPEYALTFVASDIQVITHPINGWLDGYEPSQRRPISLS
jgi:hypothetical protein